MPADRFFGTAPEVLATLKARIAGNALDLARNGIPKKPFYITGRVGDQPFSVHAEGERVILTRADGREEIELASPLPPKAPEIPASLCPDGSPGAEVGDTDAGQDEPPASDHHSPSPTEKPPEKRDAV